MHRRSVISKLPFVAAAVSVVLAISCAGRGSGTGQPYYGPGTGPIASFLPNGGLGSLKTTEYVYWVNATTNDLAIYAIDSQTGCVSPVGSNNDSTGARPIAVAPFPDPSKRFLYVGCAGNGDILIYKIDPQGSGKVTPAPTSFNISQQGMFVDMQFRGDGAFLYVLTNIQVGGGMQTITTGVLTCLKPDVQTTSSTGALNPPQNQPGVQIQSTIQLATPAPGLTATAFCIDPNNQFAYCTLSDGRIVTVGLSNQGSLSITQQKANGQNFLNGQTSPTAIAAYQTFVYAGSAVASFLNFIQTAQGQLTLSQSGFDTGGQVPVAITIPITGGNLFTVNGQSNDISCFTLASANGVLGPVPLPPPLSGAKIDPMSGQNGKAVRARAMDINFTSKFAIVLCNGKPPMPLIPAQLSCYQIQGGLLVPAPASTATGPIGQPFANVAVQKGGQFGEQTLLCPHAIAIHNTN